MPVFKEVAGHTIPHHVLPLLNQTHAAPSIRKQVRRTRTLARFTECWLYPPTICARHTACGTTAPAQCFLMTQSADHQEQWRSKPVVGVLRMCGLPYQANATQQQATKKKKRRAAAKRRTKTRAMARATVDTTPRRRQTQYEMPRSSLRSRAAAAAVGVANRAASGAAASPGVVAGDSGLASCGSSVAVGRAFTMPFARRWRTMGGVTANASAKRAGMRSLWAPYLHTTQAAKKSS